MACGRYRDALSEHAAGARAPAALAAHLAECGECRAELVSLRRALAALDADLAELVTAEPAPGFGARVRAAVSAEAVERPRARLWPALAAAATLLVAVALVVRRAPEPTVQPAAGRDPRAARTEPTPAPVPAAPAAAPAPRRTASAAVARKPAPAPGGPAVLLPPGQVEALVRLASFVQREGLAPMGLRSAGQAPADLPLPPDIEIQPLEIVPLDPAEATGT
jgi:hypothetical protein